MRAGQQHGPSAMSSETVTIKLYRDTDFSRTICGFDTMYCMVGGLKPKNDCGKILKTFCEDVQYKQLKMLLFHKFSRSNRTS